MPLVNEVVIPLGQKDRFNASEPDDDAQFGSFVLDPEPARLIPVLYPGVTVPPAPRNDLAAIFLTGIPGLNKPANVRASEMIRLNMAIAPSPDSTPNRLGLLAGQNDGFPNGRRLGDDVVDIELRALAGGTPFTPAFNHSPNNCPVRRGRSQRQAVPDHLPLRRAAVRRGLARASQPGLVGVSRFCNASVGAAPGGS